MLDALLARLWPRWTIAIDLARPTAAGAGAAARRRRAGRVPPAAAAVRAPTRRAALARGARRSTRRAGRPPVRAHAGLAGGAALAVWPLARRRAARPGRGARASGRCSTSSCTEVLAPAAGADWRDFLLRTSGAARARPRRAAAAVTGDARAAARLDAHRAAGPVRHDVLDAAEPHAAAARPVPRRAARRGCASTTRSGWPQLRRRAADGEPDPVRAAAAAAARRRRSTRRRRRCSRTLPTLHRHRRRRRTVAHLVGSSSRRRTPRCRRSCAYGARAGRAGRSWDFPAMLAGGTRRRDRLRRARRRRAPARWPRAHQALALMRARPQRREPRRGSGTLRARPLPHDTRILVARTPSIWLALDGSARCIAAAPLPTSCSTLLAAQRRRVDLWYRDAPRCRGSTACPAPRALLQRHVAEQLLRVAGDRADCRCARWALLSQAWRALWRGRTSPRASARDARAAEDDAAVGQAAPPNAIGCALQLRVLRRALRGDRDAGARRRRTPVDAHPRRAAGAESAGTATTLASCTAVGGRLRRRGRVCVDGAGCGRRRARRGCRRRGMQAGAGRRARRLAAQLAWLEGRATRRSRCGSQALAATKTRCDLMGQAVETAAAGSPRRFWREARRRGRGGGWLGAGVRARATPDRASARHAVRAAERCGGWPRSTGAARCRSAVPHVAAALARCRASAAAAGRAGGGRGRTGRAAARGLTHRARLEVLARIAAGDSNKLIARALRPRACTRSSATSPTSSTSSAPLREGRRRRVPPAGRLIAPRMPRSVAMARRDGLAAGPAMAPPGDAAPAPDPQTAFPCRPRGRRPDGTDEGPAIWTPTRPSPRCPATPTSPRLRRPPPRPPRRSPPKPQRPPRHRGSTSTSSFTSALRGLMHRTVAAVGAMDLDDDVERGAALDQVTLLLATLRGHVRHENEFVHTAIEARRPGAALQTADDHDAHLDAIADLEDEARRLRVAPAAQRAALALRLYRHRRYAFVGENLVHMQVEETVNNAVLWALYSDDELVALHDRLMASIPPDEIAMTVRWMATTLAVPELAMLFADLRTKAPAPAVEALLGAVRDEVDAARWEQAGARDRARRSGLPRSCERTA
ncbi:MAG: hypothetical protein MZW92_42155 [Comamonadaceae bacterium]|nr:hypothetical protein [Comamonadaceae bacterium]